MKLSFKNFLLFAFVLVEMSLSMVMATPAVPVITLSERSEFLLMKPKVTISFTVARRRDCDGFGICDLVISGSVRTGNKGNGVLYLDDASRNTLVMEINKSTGITLECYNKYFKSGLYIMEDDFPIPSEITSALEVSGMKTIPAGRHKIVEKNGILYVYFPVK